MEDIKIAHAKSVTVKSKTTPSSVNGNEMKSSTAALMSDNCDVKNSATPYVAVVATASFVLGKKIVFQSKKLENDEDKKEKGKKFDEIMNSFTSTSRAGKRGRGPGLDTMTKSKGIQSSEEKTEKKKPAFDEEAILRTEEAEQASFALAAAEKAVADVIKEKDDPTNEVDNSEVAAEREKAEKFVAVALKEYEETMEKVGIAEEPPRDKVNGVKQSTKFKVIDEEIMDDLEKSVETEEEKIANAQKQPKAPDEEKELAERYGDMSLEERAFNILLDLGMIESSPDPDDPSYDSSGDDDLWPENKFD